MKTHTNYNGLHSQSSQRVLEELAEAFTSWYESDDDRDNPPGYRKENYYDSQGRRVHEEHPRSTVTWKQNGIKHDIKDNRVRLSKGANHKEHPKAWEYILVEYETRPGVTIENLQQVRAVYDRQKGRWELHLVYIEEVETPDAPGEETAGVDLGICNFAAVAYSTEEADLYPGNRLEQDGYYFPKEIAKCDDSGGDQAIRLHHKWSERRTHFFHSLAKHIVKRCVENGVGRITVGGGAGDHRRPGRLRRNHRPTRRTAGVRDRVPVGRGRLQQPAGTARRGLPLAPRDRGDDPRSGRRGRHPDLGRRRHGLRERGERLLDGPTAGGRARRP